MFKMSQMYYRAPVKYSAGLNTLLALYFEMKLLGQYL